MVWHLLQNLYFSQNVSVMHKVNHQLRQLEHHCALQMFDFQLKDWPWIFFGPLPMTNYGNYILVVTDYFTYCVEAYSLPNMEATTVAQALVTE